MAKATVTVIPLDRFLKLCEISGGAVDPAKVLALISVIRKQAGIIAEMAVIISDGVVPAGAIASLSDQMEDVRQVRIPTPDRIGTA